MDTKENFNYENIAHNQKNDKSINDINKKIIQKNNIYSNNKNQSIGSLKNTEPSSESEDLISKYMVDSNLKNCYISNKKNDNFKNNINDKINLNDKNKQESNKNKKNINYKKNKKAPKIEEYKSEYLTKNESNITAPILPMIYNSEFKIDNFTNQDKIGETKSFKNINKDIYNIYNEYKKISIIPSDKLSHLCVNESMFITQKKKNYNEISVTQRNKHKFLTIIYLTPK